MSSPNPSNHFRKWYVTRKWIPHVLAVLDKCDEFQTAITFDGNDPFDEVVEYALVRRIVEPMCILAEEMFGKTHCVVVDLFGHTQAAGQKEFVPVSVGPRMLPEVVVEALLHLLSGSAKPFLPRCVDADGVVSVLRLSSYLRRLLKQANGRLRDGAVVRRTATITDPENPDATPKKTRSRSPKYPQAPEHFEESLARARDDSERTDLLLDLEALLQILRDSGALTARDGEFCHLHLEGWKNKEIAQRYGVAEETVSRRLSRLRQLVRKLLGIDPPPTNPHGTGPPEIE